MDRSTFLRLMKFSREWNEFGMYPDELAKIQTLEYRPGHEDASEHDRCGAFHWWLNREPSEVELIKLMKLAYLDPEPLMGEDIRGYIQCAKNYTEAVAKAWCL